MDQRRSLNSLTTRHRRRADVLLVDADDTLWEDNVYFEQAIDRFISFLNHPLFSRSEVRRVLNEIEQRHICTQGYGLECLLTSFLDTFECLSCQSLTPALRETICGFTGGIREHPLELLPLVDQTLKYLAERYRLVLVTKGRPQTQLDKLTRSGLRVHFEAVEVVPEKTHTVYRDIVSRHGALPQTTWMIGNSPKSDINPALAADLNAVFIPHSDTWMLEHEQVQTPDPPSRLLVLSTFADLGQHF